jgi:hypothetical protein
MQKSPVDFMETAKTDETPPIFSEQGGIPAQKKAARTRIYFPEKEFLSWIAEAEKAGCRVRGAKPYTQKIIAGGVLLIPNTKGLAKFARRILFPAWVAGEAARLEEEARVKAAAAKIGLEVVKHK